MKILLISGHGAGDSGAVSKINGVTYKEADLTREMTSLIKPLLEEYGASVDIYPTSRDAYRDGVNGNLNSLAQFKKYNYVLEIHFNSAAKDLKGDGKTTGVEIFVTNAEKGITVEQNIVNKISALGLRNRGVKRSNFLVIRTAKNAGVSSALLEVCFLDDADDVKLYINNKKKIAQAIADGVASGFGLKKVSKATATTSTKPTTSAPAKKSIDIIAREVIAGKWGNGSTRKTKLTQAGYNYNEVQKKVNQLLK